jgi:hypothetical protein
MSKNAQFQLGEHYDETFKGLNPKEILDNLEGLAYTKEEGVYTKDLSEAELGKAKHDFAEIGLEIAKIEGDKKDAMEVFKTQLKEPKLKNNALLEMLKYKKIEKEGVLWLIDDQEKGMMYKFDENGICVDVRPLQRGERQLKMTVKKASNS